MYLLHAKFYDYHSVELFEGMEVKPIFCSLFHEPLMVIWKSLSS